MNTQTKAVCPICNKAYKVDKQGLLVRHGFRGNSGRGAAGDAYGCVGSHLSTEGDILQNAIDELRSNIADDWTTDEEREQSRPLLAKLEKLRGE